MINYQLRHKSGSFPIVLFLACYLSWVGKADHPKEAMLEVSRQAEETALTICMTSDILCEASLQ